MIRPPFGNSRRDIASGASPLAKPARTCQRPPWHSAGMTNDAKSFAAYGAIADTLHTYIDSARRGDAAQMRTAFLGEASIRGSYGGKATDWTVAEFCSVIDKGGPAADLQARVVTIELSGSAAMARLETPDWPAP